MASSTKKVARDSKKRDKSATTKKSATTQPPANFKSSEFVEESGEEDEADAVAQSESDAENSTDSTAPAPNANGKTADDDTSSSESDGEDPGSGSAEEDDSEDEHEDSAASKTPENVQSIKQATNPSRTKTVSFKDASPFVPPEGFAPASMNDEDVSRASNLFRKSNIEGKQVWYLTAPASIPLASIQKMSLKAIKKGTKVVSHKNNDYGFTEDSLEEKEHTKIMIPNSSDAGYRTGITTIDRTLHLRQIVELPSVHGIVAEDIPDKVVSTRATIPAKKPVRQQPKGLKMRFTPIGFGSGEGGRLGTPESDSDVDMEDTVPQFRHPIALPATDSSDVEMDDVSNAPTKNKKSDKTSKSKSATKATEKSLKRKHKEEGSARANKSSFTSSTTDGPQLKRVKTKQAKSQEDKRSVSTEASEVVRSEPPSAAPSKTVTLFPPPVSSKTPALSKTSDSTRIPKSKPVSRIIKPVQSQSFGHSGPQLQADGQTSEDLLNVVKSKPESTDKQRKKELKKLKKSHASSSRELILDVSGPTVAPTSSLSSKPNSLAEIPLPSNTSSTGLEEGSISTSSKSKKRKREQGSVLGEKQDVEQKQSKGSLTLLQPRSTSAILPPKTFSMR